MTDKPFSINVRGRLIDLSVPRVMGIINVTPDSFFSESRVASEAEIIEKAGAGYWAIGNDKDSVYTLFDKMCNDVTLRKKMGENGYNFYLENLTSEIAYNTIINQINEAKA